MSAGHFTIVTSADPPHDGVRWGPARTIVGELDTQTRN
jgi:hypothetical protein